ncbi:hypothetical protein IWZ01DRAFT_88707 [Phyllosticta capitalensis]
MMDEACSGTTAKGKKRISLFLLHSVCSAVVEASRTAPDWLAPLAGFTCHELAGVAQHRRPQSWQCRPSLSLTASTSTQPGVYPRLSPSNQPPRTQRCGLRFVDSSDSRTNSRVGRLSCVCSLCGPPARARCERARTDGQVRSVCALVYVRASFARRAPVPDDLVCATHYWY